MNWKLIFAQAASGFLAAVIVDIHAWSKSGGEPFSWGLAFKRWVAGAISGVAGGQGFGVMFGPSAPVVDVPPGA